MCNLSQSIYEKGEKTGIKKGEEFGVKKGQTEMAIRLIQQGIDINIISEASNISLDELKEIKNKLISSNEVGNKL